MRFQWISWRPAGGVLAVVAILAGCSEPAVESAIPIAPAPVEQPAAAPHPQPAVGSANVSTPAEPIAEESGEQTVAQVADSNAAPPSDYTPPFPDRVDLFVAPKRQGGAPSQQGEGQDAVELLGFIKLDRSKVVLSVNGQVVPIAEGATEYGIEVISIQPPMVVLQRGRQRWQASLEN